MGGRPAICAPRGAARRARRRARDSSRRASRSSPTWRLAISTGPTRQRRSSATRASRPRRGERQRSVVAPRRRRLRVRSRGRRGRAHRGRGQRARGRARCADVYISSRPGILLTTALERSPIPGPATNLERFAEEHGFEGFFWSISSGPSSRARRCRRLRQDGQRAHVARSRAGPQSRLARERRTDAPPSAVL